MEAISTFLEGKIDFRGQSLSNRYQQESMVLAAVVAYVLGWAFDSLSLALYLFGAVFAGVMVLCVPAWGMYNRHDTVWLANSKQEDEEGEGEKKKE